MERANSNSKTLFNKDCSLGSVKNLSNEREREREREREGEGGEREREREGGEREREQN